MHQTSTTTKKVGSEVKSSKSSAFVTKQLRGGNVAISSYVARTLASRKKRTQSVAGYKSSEDRIIKLMKEFSAKYGFTNLVLAEILDVSLKTLSRYQANSKELSPQQKDRVEMVASILVLGKRILGDENEVKNWLNEQVYSIENQKPIDLIVSESGRRRVENVLLQIEGGAY